MNINEEDYFNIDFDNFVLPFRISGEAIKDYKYFQEVYITPRVLLNMLNHSLTTNKEVMGYLAGHFKDHSYFITDAVALPVEGTETRVVADDASIYKALLHFDDMNLLGHLERDTGWYHSHPGLWCFFSFMDVANHRQNQSARCGCFVGLVIDPSNTASSGKIHLGAYSTIPADKVIEKPIPDDILAKYRKAANAYYELVIHYFVTKTDDIILKDIISRSYYQTISSSPLDSNSKYISKNVEACASQIQRINTSEQRDDDIPLLKKVIQTINNDRETGIKINRMKKTVFG